MNKMYFEDLEIIEGVFSYKSRRAVLNGEVTWSCGYDVCEALRALELDSEADELEAEQWRDSTIKQNTLSDWIIENTCRADRHGQPTGNYEYMGYVSGLLEQMEAEGPSDNEEMIAADLQESGVYLIRERDDTNKHLEKLMPTQKSLSICSSDNLTGYQLGIGFGGAHV